MALSKVAKGAISIALLLCSNCFMNAAQFLHLKFENWSYIQSIFISWAIALPEYSLQVPANRLGHQSSGGPFTAPQLKIIAETFSLTMFGIFSTLVLKEKLLWVDLGAFALIMAGVLLSLLTKQAPSLPSVAPPPAPVPPVPGAELSSLSTGRQMTIELPKASPGGHGVDVVVVSGDGTLEPSPAGGGTPADSVAFEGLAESGGAAENGAATASHGELRHRGRVSPVAGED